MCPECLWRVDQYVSKLGFSKENLMIIKRKVVDQEENKVKPGKWHCDNCKHSVPLNSSCSHCYFDEKGFKTLNFWKCTKCGKFNQKDS